MPPTEAIEEPQRLCCPITHVLYRDPIFVPDSGNTFERGALEQFWSQSGRRVDPLTNAPLTTDTVYTNWDKRREVAAWLAEHPTYTPQGWQSRDDVPAAQARRPAQASLRVPALLQRWPSVRSCVVATVVGGALLAGLGVHEYMLGVQPSIRGECRWHADDDAHPDVSGEPDIIEALSNELAQSKHHLGMPYDLFVRARMPAGSRLQVRVHRHVDELKVNHDGLRLSLPRAKLLPTLFTAESAMSAFVLGFTFVWTAGAYNAAAPLPFVCFSAPFWFAGASMLKGVAISLLERSALTLHQHGLQIERSIADFGEHVSRCDVLSWQDMWNVARSNRIAFRGHASKARQLWELFLEPSVYGYVNGVPLSALVFRDGKGLEETWGRGLSQAELQYVSATMVDYLMGFWPDDGYAAAGTSEDLERARAKEREAWREEALRAEWQAEQRKRQPDARPDAFE